MPWSVNLYFQHDAGNGTLDDIGSVEAVDAVDAKYASLFTDCATSVNPEQTTSVEQWTRKLRASNTWLISQPRVTARNANQINSAKTDQLDSHRLSL